MNEEEEKHTEKWNESLAHAKPRTLPKHKFKEERKTLCSFHRFSFNVNKYKKCKHYQDFLAHVFQELSDLLPFR